MHTIKVGDIVDAYDLRDGAKVESARKVEALEVHQVPVVENGVEQQIDKLMAKLEGCEYWLPAKCCKLVPVPAPTVVKKAKRVRPKSRPQRWADAVGRAQIALEGMRSQMDEVEQATADLREVQEEYESWRDSLPENLQTNGPVAEKLEEVCSIDIEDIASNLSEALDSAESAIGDAEAVELPRGFGKD